MSNRADVERVRNEYRKIRKKLCNYHDDLTDRSHDLHIYMGVLDLNEVITKEMIEGGYVPEVIFDKLEEYKSAVEWFDTFKFQVRKAMEQNGVKKWSTDLFDFDYIEEHMSPRVDTKRMKETFFDIVDANGEVTRVNAYDYFVKNAKVKAHVSYKEKR